MLSKRTIAIGCGFLVALFYAYNFTAAKEITPAHIGPFGLTWYRVLVTCIVFWLVALIFEPKDARIPFKKLPKVALAAFCGVGFNMVTFMWGLSMTSLISASVLMVTTPIIVLILSAIFLKERLFPVRIVGIIIGFIGAALLIITGTTAQVNATDPLTGNFLIFINAVSYSFYIILAKGLTAQYHVLSLMKWLYFFGVLFVTPFCIQQGIEFDFTTAQGSTLLYMGYVILFATVGTYGLNIIAIKTLRPSVVAVFVYLQPLLAAIIAMSLGKDYLNFNKAIAALCIFTGVYLTSKKSKKSKAVS